MLIPIKVAVGKSLEPAVMTFFLTMCLCVRVCVFVCVNSSSQCSSDDDTVSSVSQQRASKGRRDSMVS